MADQFELLRGLIKLQVTGYARARRQIDDLQRRVTRLAKGRINIPSAAAAAAAAAKAAARQGTGEDAVDLKAVRDQLKREMRLHRQATNEKIKLARLTRQELQAAGRKTDRAATGVTREEKQGADFLRRVQREAVRLTNERFRNERGKQQDLNQLVNSLLKKREAAERKAAAARNKSVRESQQQLGREINLNRKAAQERARLAREADAASRRSASFYLTQLTRSGRALRQRQQAAAQASAKTASNARKAAAYYARQLNQSARALRARQAAAKQAAAKLASDARKSAAFYARQLNQSARSLRQRQTAARQAAAKQASDARKSAAYYNAQLNRSARALRRRQAAITAAGRAAVLSDQTTLRYQQRLENIQLRVAANRRSGNLQGLQVAQQQIRQLQQQLALNQQINASQRAVVSTQARSAAATAAGAAAYVRGRAGLLAFAGGLSRVGSFALRATSFLGRTALAVGRFAVAFGRGLVSTVVSGARILTNAIGRLGGVFINFAFGPVLSVIRTIRLLSRVVLPGVIFGTLIYETKKAIETFNEFDETMKRVEGSFVSAGTVGSRNIQILGRLVRDIAIETQFNAQEVGDTLQALIKGGVKAPEGVLRDTVNFAIAARLSPDDAAKFAASALNQFGLDRKQFTRVADAFLSASLQAQIGVEDLAEALKTGGGAANLAAVNLEDYLAVVTAVAKRIPAGSLAGTAIGRSFTRILAPTAEGEQVLDGLLRRVNRRLEDFTNENKTRFTDFIGLLGALEQAGATLPDFQKIFGERGRQIAAVLGDTGDLEDGLRTMREIQNIIRQDIAQGLTGQVSEIVKNSISGIFKNIGDSLTEIKLSLIERFAAPIQTALGKVRDFLNNTVLQWVRQSQQLVTFAYGLANAFSVVVEAVRPLIGRYLRLSAVTTAGLVVAFLNLARLAAGPLHRAFVAVTGTVSRFAGLAVDPLSSWSATFQFITQLITNWRQYFDIAILTIKRNVLLFLLNLRDNMAKIFQRFGDIQPLIRFFQSMVPIGEAAFNLLATTAKIAFGNMFSDVLERFGVEASRANKKFHARIAEFFGQKDLAQRLRDSGDREIQLLDRISIARQGLRQRERNADIARDQQALNRALGQFRRGIQDQFGERIANSILPADTMIGSLRIIDRQIAGIGRTIQRVPPDFIGPDDELSRKAREIERIGRAFQDVQKSGEQGDFAPIETNVKTTVTASVVGLEDFQRRIQLDTVDVDEQMLDVSRSQLRELRGIGRKIEKLQPQGFARLG